MDKVQEKLAEGASNNKGASSPILPEPRTKGQSKAKDKGKAPAPSKEGNGKGVKKDKPKDEKDQFGFRINSKASLFCKTVMDAGKSGITMEDVRKAKWNENKATYFGTLGKLKKMGRAKVENGKIFFVR